VDRHLRFERLHNFRDLGGYVTSTGQQVRWGRLYRSDNLAKLRGADWDRFLALHITTVIDLRYPWEIDGRGRIPEHHSFRYYNLSIEHRPYDQSQLGPDLEVASYLADRYLEVAYDGADEIRQALDVIAAADGPVAFHCASGKDRTGLLSALVLGLLGVSEDDIVNDFARTGLATERLIAEWHANHPDRELVWPGFGKAPAALMRRFLAELAARHGSLRGYAAELLDVDDSLVTALRQRLLDQASPVPG
jgi:protein-tyrosine phosphatase